MASESSSVATNNRPATNISIWQKLDFLPAFLQILGGTTATAVLAPFRGEKTPTTFKRHVVLYLMRRTVGRLSTKQLQWVAGTTGANFKAWAKTQKIQPQSIVLPKTQASAFWLGDRNAENVCLYFHGGGFAMPASDGLFKFLSHIKATAAESGKSLAFLILEYDLAPRKQYPHQLGQCVELVRYAVTQLNKSPNQLMLGGDSAGVNLVFATILHLLDPHPAIEPLKLSQPLRAAFGASPWIDFDMTSERFRSNDAFDAAPVSALRTWARDYVGSSKPDKWREPGKAEAKSWEGLEKVVADILITIAKEEVMADDVKRMAENIKTEYQKLTLFEAAADFHAEPALGSNAGFEEGEASKVIRSWMADKC